jgi:hypothetical protein
MYSFNMLTIFILKATPFGIAFANNRSKRGFLHRVYSNIPKLTEA